MTTQAIYPKVDEPTIYFIGVTTEKSFNMKVFPAWAKHLKLGNVANKDFDLKLHDEPSCYRAVVELIKRDPLSLGALVTTHKIDLLKACRDRFDELDEYAQLMGEVNSISKHSGKLVEHAKEPITSGLALEAFLPSRYWEETDVPGIYAHTSVMERGHRIEVPSCEEFANTKACLAEPIPGIGTRQGKREERI